MKKDMKERKCGCIYFQVGPPIKCEKHRAKVRVKEEKTVRQIAADTAFELGHDLTSFREYNSQRGKWTAYCRTCGCIAIVYNDVPTLGDQILGRALTERCGGGSALQRALHDLGPLQSDGPDDVQAQGSQHAD